MDLVVTDYKVRNLRSLPRVERAKAKLAERFAGAKAVEITSDDIHTYRDDRRLKDGAAEATVYYELAMFKRAFRLAVKRGRLPHMPGFPEMGEPDNARREFIDPDDFAALQAELPAYLRPVFAFAYCTGWRVRSELLGVERGYELLSWDQVNFKTGIITLPTSKNNKPRRLPFRDDPDLNALLKDLWAKRNGPFVFHRNGKRIRDFYGDWRSACRRAGVIGNDGRPKRPHDFRRTRVRELDQAGVPRTVAKRLVGHETDSMYERYAIQTEGDARNGMRKAAARRRWGPQEQQREQKQDAKAPAE